MKRSAVAALFCEKKAAGARVYIVFVTDGSRSHEGLIPEAALKARRQQEALQAAQMLGVGPEDVIFLGFGDGRLTQAVNEAIGEASMPGESNVLTQVQSLLATYTPDEVFVPHPEDRLADHTATYRVAIAALQSLPPERAQSIAVYAYPIWYWRHWPWTPLGGNGKREMLNILKATVRNGLGTAVFEDFQHSVYVGEVRSQKQAALAMHISQMQRPDSIPNWSILSDVAGGDFLDCAMQDYEIFHSPQGVFSQPIENKQIPQQISQQIPQQISQQPFGEVVSP